MALNVRLTQDIDAPESAKAFDLKILGPIPGGGGGGAVSSVNGQTGAVVLDAQDVGAAESIQYASLSDLDALTDVATYQQGVVHIADIGDFFDIPEMVGTDGYAFVLTYPKYVDAGGPLVATIQQNVMYGWYGGIIESRVYATDFGWTPWSRSVLTTLAASPEQEGFVRFAGGAGVVQLDHIEDAVDATDVVTKFNDLLTQLQNWSFMAANVVE